jgi:glyoxylase-like metal-dependent hydrolase (beta-lactamase superfamily II)
MFARIEVPTPFQVGDLNAYLAGETLIDPGPDGEESWTALLGGLDEAGVAPADLSKVLVTHPHPDHFGLAGRLREAGASVLASPQAADVIADFADHLDRQQAWFSSFFQRCGLPAETARAVTELPEAFLSYTANVTVDRTLGPGDEVAVADWTVTVDAVEGHAPGELIFEYTAGGEHCAVVGDHVLGTITPTPLLQVPDPGEERPRVLPAYNRSLRRLGEVGHDRLLPGHGDPVESPPERIDEILDAHERRSERVRELVDGPTTPVEVMEGLFDDLPVTEQFPGLSEAVGHLDVLEERGVVVQREQGGLIRYERAAESEEVGDSQSHGQVE